MPVASLLLVLISISVSASAGRPVILDAAADPYASEYVFIGTGAGVYAFNRSSATWTRYNTESGLPDNQVNALGLDQGVLWVGTGRGLASADIQVNDWQTWDIGEVNGLAFDDRYAWAATDAGLLRFDKYAERWDTVATGRHDAVLAAQDGLWCANDSGVGWYSLTYERFEDRAAPAGAYEHIFATPGRTWFVGADRVAARRSGNDDWSDYPGIGLEDWAALGDSLFAVAGDTLLLFDPSAGNWRGLPDIPLPGPARGIAIAGDTLLIATEQGLVSWSMKDRAARTTTTANGMSDNALLACQADSRYIFAVSATGVDILDRATGNWRTEPLRSAFGIRRSAFSIDDAGAHLRLIPGADIRLTGRTSITDTRTIADIGAGNPVEVTSLALGIGGSGPGRSLALYFDDTDQRQVDYGANYRGRAGDILARLNAGQTKSEYYEFSLIPGLSLLGANARLRPPLRKSAIDNLESSIALQAGVIKSRRQSDHYTGRASEREVVRRDIDYAARTFYQAADLRGLAGIDTVFVDDHDQATNGPGTRAGRNIAGIVGDWDALVGGIDYYYHPDSGLVRFVEPRLAADDVVAATGATTTVLQHGAASSALANIYSFQPGIIPGTFQLTITDTLGAALPLADFGIDRNADGRVDIEFLDCDRGWLRFPAQRPFPDRVYDDTLHIYTLAARYRTEIASYQLSGRPVVKNSEEVTVDGAKLTRGTDYIIAYSPGLLTMLRRDLIADQSRISVQYSVTADTGAGLLYSAQPDIAIGDVVHIAPGFTGVDRKGIAHLTGKIQAGDAGRSVTIVPQLALGLNRSLAQNHLLTE